MCLDPYVFGDWLRQMGFPPNNIDYHSRHHVLVDRALGYGTEGLDFDLFVDENLLLHGVQNSRSYGGPTRAALPQTDQC